MDFAGIVAGNPSASTSPASIPPALRPERYILVLQDYFSRYVKLYSCTTNDGPTVVRCLRDYISDFDRPLRFKSDNSPFNCITVRNFLKEQGIVPSFSLPHHPESQGTVERLNNPLVRFLRSRVGLDTYTWAQFVRDAEWFLNTSFLRR